MSGDLFYQGAVMVLLVLIFIVVQRTAKYLEGMAKEIEQIKALVARR